MLSLHARCPNLKNAELARQLKVAESTLHHRFKELRRQGVLIGHAYWLESAKFGVFPFRLLIVEKSPTSAFRRKLFDFARQHPHIVAFVHAVGNWDYELNLEVYEPPQVNMIVEELYDRFGRHIEVVKSLTHLQHIKSCQFPF